MQRPQQSISKNFYKIAPHPEVLTTLLIFLLLQNPCTARVNFCAVGDILLDRGIRKKIQEHGVDYPFEKISEFVKKYDLAFCNLECPVSARGISTGKIYCFRADTQFFTGVKNAGFNIFSLANNHIIDWGEKACMDTKEIIEKNSLHAIGVGKNQKDALNPIIIRRNGLRFAFLASVGIPLKGIIWPVSKTGPAQASLEEIVKEVERMRTEVDFVIVSCHWGIEYQHSPTTYQVQWARRIVDAGADLVIGHHPHVLQSIEIYKNRFILYSLGNFVFDQRKQYQRQSGIFTCVFKKGSIDSASFHPVMLEDFRPGFAEDSAFLLIEEKITNISTDRNARFLNVNNHILLSDTTSTLHFKTPLRYAKMDNNDVMVYKDAIELVDSCGLIVDTCALERNRRIKDCCIIKDSTALHIFALIGPIDTTWADCIAHYVITKSRITKIWPYYYPGYDFWKIASVDIDGDSVFEIGVGVYDKTGNHTTRKNRLCIYNWRDGYIYAKWCSSQISMPFIDFEFLDIDDDGLDNLVTIEIGKKNTKKIMIYQWCGFAFWAYRKSTCASGELWLSNIDLQYLISEK